MRSCFCFLTVLVLSLTLSACQGLDALNRVPDSKFLEPIHYYYNDISAAYDCDVKIGINGEISIMERHGAGARDKRTVTSHILDEERAALIAGFQGWNNLKQYYSSDVSPLIQISYGDHFVQTSSLSSMPANYLRAKGELDKIVDFLLKEADAKTAAAAKAAAEAATQAATAPVDVP